MRPLPLLDGDRKSYAIRYVSLGQSPNEAPIDWRFPCGAGRPIFGQEGQQNGVHLGAFPQGPDDRVAIETLVW